MENRQQKKMNAAGVYRKKHHSGNRKGMKGTTTTEKDQTIPSFFKHTLSDSHIYTQRNESQFRCFKKQAKQFV